MPDRKHYRARKRRGMCVECGTRPVLEHVRCTHCLRVRREQKHRYEMRTYRARAEEERARLKRMRVRMISERRCSRCLRPLDPESDRGRKQCITCRERLAS